MQAASLPTRPYTQPVFVQSSWQWYQMAPWTLPTDDFWKHRDAPFANGGQFTWRHKETSNRHSVTAPPPPPGLQNEQPPQAAPGSGSWLVISAMSPSFSLSVISLGNKAATPACLVFQSPFHLGNRFASICSIDLPLVSAHETACWDYTLL